MSFSQSLFAAKLQELVSRRREESGLYTEIADHIPLVDSGRLLDIGTGTGLQLRVIAEMKPDLALYGLDISTKAIEIARGYFTPGEVNLSVGNIKKTTYPDDFFDIITCASSMSYWKNLVQCFNEIHRILKPGGSAHLFEPQQDIDIEEVERTIRINMQRSGWLRTTLAVAINKFALQRGNRIGLHLHSTSEVKALAHQSNFGNRVTVERVTLQNLPIFMQIILQKI